ncbi:MAG: response regulator transcription factor [Candidatus Acidiferrum sp.]
MTATVKTAISPIRHDLNSGFFLDEVLASVAANTVPDECPKLSGFLPVLVLIAKSAVQQTTNANKSLLPDQVTARINGNWVIPLHPATAGFQNPKDDDTFVFGQVTLNTSTMETHRKGQPVTLTHKEFKTLSYFVENARRVISREELLKEVWGYHCYPCTRTVDNHILRLRQKLELEPSHPKHFLTIHGTGYKFLP